MNKCGACRACCRALGVVELEKPEWQMCHHVCKEGCGIYDARPASCVKYKCVWLQSQEGADPLPSRLRPDRCGVIFDHMDSMPDDVCIARIPPGGNGLLNDPYVRSVIGSLVEQGQRVYVRMGDQTSAPVRAIKSDTRPIKPVVIRGLK